MQHDSQFLKAKETLSKNHKLLENIQSSFISELN